MLRRLVLVALLLTAFLPGAQAQDTAYTARIGLGDIPTTDTVEDAGVWHVVQTLPFDHDGTTEVSLSFPYGSGEPSWSCTCNVTGVAGEDAVTWTLGNETAAGSYEAQLWTQAQGAHAFATEWPLPEGAVGGRVITFTPPGLEVDALEDGMSPGVTTDGTRTITEFPITSPEPFWVSVHRANGATPLAPDAGFDFIALAIGLAAGIVLWYVLVQQGIAQKRSRKQVAATAAHTVAASEGKATLEARKRVLMAALKDIEMAKMNQEVSTEAYDIVKAELKKQTVTVMRALEQAE